MFALSLSLAACMGWGIADFLGGIKSRRLPSLTVLVFSNAIGFAVIGSIVCLRGKGLPEDPELYWAVAGGMAGVAGMFMLYRGFVVGAMSIVAPISATGVALPVLLGLALGDSLNLSQAIGIAAAVTGSVLAGRGKGMNPGRGPFAEGVWLAVGAALAFGIFFVVMDRASEADPYWASFVMRLSYGVFLIPLVARARPSLRIDRMHVPGIFFIGTLDALAGFAFALATTIGMLSLVSVVGALYPVVTVLLSVMILGERPQRTQSVGVILALVGVALISAG